VELVGYGESVDKRMIGWHFVSVSLDVFANLRKENYLHGIGIKR